MKVALDLICEQLSLVSASCTPSEFEIKNENTERRMKKEFDYLECQGIFLVQQFQLCMTMHSTVINQSFNILLKERKELTSLCRRATFKSLRFALILTSSLRAVTVKRGFSPAKFQLWVTSLFNDHWPHIEPQSNLNNLESPQK